MASNTALAPHSPALAVGKSTNSPKDYLARSEGLVHAGTHLLIDFWEASGLDDMTRVERALRDAVAACQARLLHIHLHQFSENGGVSGVAVLAESHISIHTWPELGYAAFDVFMCGECDPRRAIPVLRRSFLPRREEVGEHKRGILE